MDESDFHMLDNNLCRIEKRLADIVSVLIDLGTDIGAIEALDQQIRKSGDKIVEQIDKSADRIARMIGCLE